MWHKIAKATIALTLPVLYAVQPYVGKTNPNLPSIWVAIQISGLASLLAYLQAIRERDVAKVEPKSLK